MKRIAAALSTIALAAGLGAVAVPAASAADVITVHVEGNDVIVTGTPGADTPTVNGDCSTGTHCIEFIETDGFGYAAPCVQASTYSVHCPTPGPPTVRVNLHEGNDEFSTRDLEPGQTVIVDAGPGNDVLEGGGAIETWILGEGDDKLEADWIGGPEDVGPDDISGGPGKDYVDYLFSAADDLGGKTISLDDVANDTSAIPGDVDNVRSDVEHVRGTNSDDTITGNDLPQTIEGASGNDTIKGMGGDDTIDGRGGADTIDGGAGADTIYGGADNDTIVGGPGYDTINGDATDLLITGNDVINSVDGEEDYVACGPGSDTVSADHLDKIAVQAQDNCENVSLTKEPTKPDPGEPGGPGTPGEPGSGAATVKGKKLDADKRRKKATIAIACATGADCSGSIVAKAGKKVVAKGKYAVAAGSTSKVKVKLTKKARKLLKRKKSVRVKVTLSAGSSRKVKLTR